MTKNVFGCLLHSGFNHLPPPLNHPPSFKFSNICQHGWKALLLGSTIFAGFLTDPAMACSENFLPPADKDAASSKILIDELTKKIAALPFISEPSMPGPKFIFDMDDHPKMSTKILLDDHTEKSAEFHDFLGTVKKYLEREGLGSEVEKTAQAGAKDQFPYIKIEPPAKIFGKTEALTANTQEDAPGKTKSPPLARQVALNSAVGQIYWPTVKAKLEQNLSEAEQAAEIDQLLASAKDEAALTHFWAREVSLRTYFTDPAYWYEVKRIWQDRDLKAKFFRYHYLFYQRYITAMAQKLKALDDAWVLQETSAGSLPPLKLIELKITPQNIDRLAANSALVERLPIIKDLKSFWDGQSVDANTSLSLVLGELHLPNFIAKQDFNLLGGKVPQAAYLNNKLYLAWNSLADVHFAYPTNLHELMHYKKVNQRIQMLVPNIIGQVRITEGYPKFLDMSELDAYITQLDISKHLASENASGKDHWNFARQEAEGNLIDIANNTEPLLNEVKAQLSAMDLSGDCPFVYTIGANAKNDGISWRKPDLAVLLYHKADAPRDTILVQCPVKDAALIEQNAMRQLGINDAQDPQVKKAVKEELRKQVLAEIDEEIKIMITYMCMYYSGRR